MSEPILTPRTSAVAYDLESVNPGGMLKTDEPSGNYVDSSFARQLETELSTVNQQLADARVEIDEYETEAAARRCAGGDEAALIDANSRNLNLLQTVERLHSKLSAALALADENGRKCAGMREVLEQYEAWAKDKQPGYNCTCCREYLLTKHHLPDCPRLLGAKALSSDAGKVLASCDTK